MKILTTNSAGNDVFGGIHTRKNEQVRNSPQHTFHVIELNQEKKYISYKNLNAHKIDTPSLTHGKTIFELLKESKNRQEFDVSVERLVNEFQNVIRVTKPDSILIPGTSLTSYFLFKACRREGVLNKTVQEYAGVLEKEIGNYTGDTRFILGQIGKTFVSDEARDNVIYIFPSQLCKDEVENIHGIIISNGYVIWNGVSKEFVSGDFNRGPPKELTLGYVGRIQHVKNLPFFLSINENISRKAKLKIITDISSAARRNVGTVLLQKMNSGDVFYYAPRSRDQLKEFYETQLSACVVPSFFETYCNVAVESLVCGTPTLLSNRAGASEVYKKYGLEKLLFDIDHIASFEGSLNYAESENFTVDEGLSRQIYEDLKWEKVISKYNEVFEEVRSRSTA
jgi:glycosyltransferase involved in cell wall biosynthesis